MYSEVAILSPLTFNDCRVRCDGCGWKALCMLEWAHDGTEQFFCSDCARDIVAHENDVLIDWDNTEWDHA